MVNVKKHVVFAVCLSGVSFILYFLLYGRLELNAIEQQEQAEKIVLAKAASVHPITTFISSPKDEFMSSIMSAAEKNGLKHIEIKWLSNESVAISGDCDFYEWLGFVEYINQLSPTIFLNDVSLEVSKTAELIINATLIRYSFAQSSAMHFQKTVQKNPFTLEDKQTVFVLSDMAKEDGLQTISVYQLQYAGSLSQNGKVQAIVKSNTGAMRLIEVGSVIGLELAKVIKITESEVVFATEKQSLIVISAQAQ